MLILDRETEFRKNISNLFGKYRFYFYALIITAFADLFSTIGFMLLTGPEKETNLFVRHLSIQLGIFLGPFIGKTCQIIAVCLFSGIVPRLSKAICILVIALNIIAIIMNFSLILHEHKEHVGDFQLKTMNIQIQVMLQSFPANGLLGGTPYQYNYRERQNEVIYSGA